MEISYEKGIDWNLKTFNRVPSQYLSFNGEKGLKGCIFPNSNLTGKPVIEKQDGTDRDSKWTLYSRTRKKLQPDSTV